MRELKKCGIPTYMAVKLINAHIPKRYMQLFMTFFCKQKTVDHYLALYRDIAVYQYKIG